MADQNILLILSDHDIEQHLDNEILSPAGYRVMATRLWSAAEEALRSGEPDVVIVGEVVGGRSYSEYIADLMNIRPSTPFGLLISAESTVEPIQAVREGFFDCWRLPGEADQVLSGVRRILYQRSRLKNSQVQSSEVNLDSILDGIDEALLVIDPNNRLALANPKARRTLGIQETDSLGLPAREVISHPDLLELLGEGRPKNPTRIELALNDGRVLNAQITPLPEIGLVISMQDITHLKELDRVKSDFVYTVSHDLRSPLTAILGYVELIDRVGPINDQQRQFIHRVQVSVQNITALINDLLDLGRIEAGFDEHKEVVALEPIVHYTVDGLAGRLNEKSQSLEIELPDDLPQVLGNPVRLRQMLSNLVINANKYTQPGGFVSIHARVEGGQVILQVTDNGPGIPPADQPYVFDKFYRAANVTADTPGTGLGLAIVRSIVENHLGRVWVESTVEQGTTFTIVLPIAQTTAA